MILFASALPASDPVPDPVPDSCPSRLERLVEHFTEVYWDFTCFCDGDGRELALSRLSQRLEVHHLRHQRWPDRLADVLDDGRPPRNPWGHELVYLPPTEPGRYPTLIDSGHDGVLGNTCGDDDDEDRVWTWVF